jgi:hypothetical protein
MKCKLFYEEGDYLDIDTQEERNMLCAERVDTPIGEEHTWIEFDTIEEAMDFYNIEEKPKLLLCPNCDLELENNECINCNYILPNAN